MTVAKKTRSIQYPSFSLERAKRAIRCAPFALQLYTTMQTQGVFLGSIVGESGVQKQYTRSPLPELVAENALMWLIEVGVLRREVDGQGITDSFRLTPLGRQLAQDWQQGGVEWTQQLTWSDRLSNTARRWLRFPL